MMHSRIALGRACREGAGGDIAKPKATLKVTPNVTPDATPKGSDFIARVHSAAKTERFSIAAGCAAMGGIGHVLPFLSLSPVVF